MLLSEPRDHSDTPTGPRTVQSTAGRLAVLLRSGVLAPTTPGRALRQLRELRRLGPTLAGTFAIGAIRAPERCAVADETSSRSYAELDLRARAIACGLAGHGLGPQDTVAVLGRNSVPFVEALTATSRLGADALLISTSLSVVQTREVLLRERPRAVFCDVDLLPLLEQVPKGLLVITLRPGDTWRGGHRTLDELAAGGGPEPLWGQRRGRMIVLTSGTTGTPKGARRPAPAGLGPAASMLSRLHLTRGDTLHIASPLFHTWGLGLLQIATALTSTVVLRVGADPETVLDAVAQTRCTALATVPMVLERVLRLPEPAHRHYDTSRLRLVVSCGAPLTVDVVDRFRAAYGDILYNVYGSTEASWATIATPSDLSISPGTAGKPPPGTRLELLDGIGRPVPPGAVGRIFVGNELLFEGYTGEDAAQWREGMVGTGDLGYLDEAGRLTVIGREDDLVISGAEKIYPAEVEEAILTLPGIREVAVTGHPDAELGQRLVAYVVCERGVRLTEREVQDHVRGRLARFAVPKEVGFVGRLPRTATGKIIRREIQASLDPSPPPTP
jgi:acyl-coenzyme A synthetase/AMP-(fatty) acid ligase